MEMGNIESGNPSLSVFEARVRQIWQEVQLQGGNDYEPSAFQEILRKLHSEEISGSEAVIEALRIQERKEDYH